MSGVRETAVHTEMDALEKLCRFFGCTVAELLECNDKAGDGEKTESLE